MLERNEDTELLVNTRHTLAKCAVHELGLPPGDIPTYKAPIKKILNTTTSATANFHSNSNSFDVYAGNRFDGQSAAVGTDLGAPKHWKSKTEQELEALQQREQKLQRQLQLQTGTTTTTNTTTTATTAANANANQHSVDRQWTVFLPGQAQPQSASSNTASNTASNSNTNTNTSSSSTKGDASLLASHFRQQHAKRVASDNRGFTTKAMRDLETLKTRKVYSHTQLAIHFPDGISVRANFATSDTIQRVVQELQASVLIEQTQALKLPDLELYRTPPRTVLKPSETLQALGLVPASKVYVSWNQPLPKRKNNHNHINNNINNNDDRCCWYIREELWQTQTAAVAASADIAMASASTSAGPALPTSIAVLPSQAEKDAKQSTTDAAAGTAKRKKMTRAEKEAAMMKRMLAKR